MAVSRINFPNAPSNGIDELDRSQRALGIPFATQSPNFDNYIRRYLDDPELVPLVGTPVVEDSVSETSDTTYLRRYLCDPV